MTTHNLERLTPASDLAPLIDLAKAKAHLRVSALSEDALIETYAAAVADYLDGYAGTLGRALRPQAWRLTLDGWPCAGFIRLPLPPFKQVTAIEYDTNAGVTATLDTALYRTRRDHGFGIVEPAYNAQWPSDVAEVRIDYECGHEAPDNPLPASITAAALLLLGSLYDLRASEVEGRIISPNPAAERLLAPLRVRSW